MSSARDTRYAVVNGARLAYSELGTGPTLLFVHDLGAIRADFDRQVDYFARIFRVIALDLRGHGESDAAGPYSVERMATDCLGFMEQLSPNANYVVVGHGLGGAVAQQMALYKPERIAKLVLAAALPSFAPNTAAKKLALTVHGMTLRTLGAPFLARKLAAQRFPDKDQQPLRDLYAKRSAGLRKGVYLDMLASLSRWSVAEKAMYFRMPVLVLVGEHGDFEPMEAQVFAEGLPDARYRIFDEAHHHLPLERPEEFNRTVMEFLVPGASATTLRGDGTLDWLKVDTLATPKINVKALLPK